MPHVRYAGRRDRRTRNTGQMWQPLINRIADDVTGTEIEGLVGNSVIERSRKVLAVIPYDADIRAKPQAVVPFYPGKVVSDVLGWRRPAEASRK